MSRNKTPAFVHTRYDVFPAKAALGVHGCTDCHSLGSEFFFAPALVHLFDENGKPVTEPQYRRLGLNPTMVMITACCQTYVKPAMYGLMLFFPYPLVMLLGGLAVNWVFGARRVPLAVRVLPILVAGALAVGIVLLFRQPELLEYMAPSRLWMDANHFLVTAGILVVGCIAWLWELRQWIAYPRQRRSGLGLVLAVIEFLALAVAVLAGILIFLKIAALDLLTRVSYTVFDVAVTILLAATIATVLRTAGGQVAGRGIEAPTA